MAKQLVADYNNDSLEVSFVKFKLCLAVVCLVMCSQGLIELGRSKAGGVPRSAS